MVMGNNFYNWWFIGTETDKVRSLHNVMIAIAEFFKKKLKKDIVMFSGEDFRKGPYEQLAKTALWKRSGARGLYSATDIWGKSFIFVYTDRGERYVTTHEIFSDIRKIKG